MSIRYAPIPNPRTDPGINPELDAAFDDSEDDLDEYFPLTGIPDQLSSPTRPSSSHDHSLDNGVNSNTPFTYDFNTPVADWDQPPPGSPPAPTSLALPNAIGNSNGIIPVLSPDTIPRAPTSWWRTSVSAVLPSHYVSRFGLDTSGRMTNGITRIIGGGASNDGVFTNVSAKPSTTGTRVQEGDSVYIVPEESLTVAPPSYASAQADAAPPYHTSTLLLPPMGFYDASSLSSPATQGSVIVDSLPTGTLFAFLWNVLVSTTFQFIGFVLTWVMHTTHAARFGSRAGLGVTLIQWGFSLRARLDDATPGADTWGDGGKLSFGSTKEAEDYYDNLGLLNNSTDLAIPTQPLPDTDRSQWDDSLLTGPLATEWLSFFLMTAGWFLLLTSSLGFWRVKRWERSILSSHVSRSSSNTSNAHRRTQSEISDEEDNENRRQSFFERLGIFRYPPPIRHQPSVLDGGVGVDSDDVSLTPGENEDGPGQGETEELQSTLPWYSNPERARRVREAILREQRLCEDLRSAGLL
ncbi:hypothetical protein PAXRUDRAFT_29680 [Paxillus rubicundulus Ve08.2h10]|uniref:Metal homeostatis protein bsd2 n=1 Tax=Paxillus rubicundulus Ve08.2h10 TaxID=930991 RepID=A0A0D0ED68_9AGAM|nr:hypothetical protein PAXRUDRAFT_29680 [Paxillus rubicundulus Ve08.2h10]